MRTPELPPKLKKVYEGIIDRISRNNFKAMKRTGIQEGFLLKRKWDGKVVRVEFIHPTYGWITGNDLNQNWSNINDFEIAYADMVIEGLKQK